MGLLQQIVTAWANAYRGLPRRVWLLALVILVNRSGTMVLPYLSLYATSKLGMQPVDVGWALASYGVGGIISGFVAGWLTERIGAIYTQMISFALSAPGFLVVGQATQLGSLCGSLFFLGLAVEMMRPAASTATIEFCDTVSQHTRALGVNRLAVNLGMSVGPTLGGYLAGWNYQYLFWLNACGGVFSLLLTYRLFGRRPKPVAADDSTVDGQREPQHHPDRKPTRKSKHQSPWRDGSFLIFCALNAIAAMVLFQFMGTYPLYLEERYHFEEYGIGLLFGLNTVVIVLFELVLVSAVQRFSLLRVFALGQLLSCLGFGLLPFAVGLSPAAGYTWCFAVMLVLTVGEMLSMPLGAAHVARCSNSQNRGRYMGAYSISYSIAFLFAPLIGTALYQRSPELPWYLSLIVGVAVFAGLNFIASRGGERSAA